MRYSVITSSAPFLRSLRHSGRLRAASTSRPLPPNKRPRGASAPTVEKDATVFGFKVHYREAGQGPAVILLHGLGWRRLALYVADGGVGRQIPGDFPGSDRLRPIGQAAGQLQPCLADRVPGRVCQDDRSAQGDAVGPLDGRLRGDLHRGDHPELVDRLVLVDGGGLVYAPRSEHLIQIQNGSTLADTRIL